MKDNENNKENKHHRNGTPTNKAELKSLSNKSDRVLVYAPKDNDDVTDDGVV